MASKASPPLFHAIIDRHPIRAVNCTTLFTTKIIAADPAHPLHIKIRRKIAAFDPQGLYWRVNCPQDISKKAVVRNGCKGEYKKAFAWALAEAGWDKDGMPLDPNGRQGRLTGAVLLNISKDPALVLTAKKADLRRDAENIVRNLAAKQGQFSSSKDWRRTERHSISARIPSGYRSTGHRERIGVKPADGLPSTRYKPI